MVGVIATIGSIYSSSRARARAEEYEEKVARGKILQQEELKRVIAASQGTEEEYQAYYQGIKDNYVKKNPPLTWEKILNSPSILNVVQGDLDRLEFYRNEYLYRQDYEAKLNEIVTAAATTQKSLSDQLEAAEKKSAAAAKAKTSTSKTSTATTPETAKPAASITAQTGQVLTTPTAAKTNYTPIIIIGIAAFYFLR